MAQETNLTATPFNNPILSDLKLKRVFNGKVREYHAHKAILCRASSFFMMAFTGHFEEASSNTMELHDDNPDAFGFVLNYLYMECYDNIVVLANAADAAALIMAIEIYTIADKYDIQKLLAPVATDICTFLRNEPKGIHDLVKLAVTTYYSKAAQVESQLDKGLTSALFQDMQEFIHTKEYGNLVRQFPVFGADITLETVWLGLIHISLARCSTCQVVTQVD